MPEYVDGPASPLFRTIPLPPSVPIEQTLRTDDSDDLASRIRTAPTGECVFRGIRFQINGVVRIGSEPTQISIEPTTARWLIFLHSAAPLKLPRLTYGGGVEPMEGVGMFGEEAARYEIGYGDGSSHTVPIRNRYEINPYHTWWGENAVTSQPHIVERPVRPHHEQRAGSWGRSQTRNDANHYAYWSEGLFAWKNPHPELPITSITLSAGVADAFLFGLAASEIEQHPLRWERRKKAVVNIAAALGKTPGSDGRGPDGEPLFDPTLDERGRMAELQIDLGTVISAMPQRLYAAGEWEASHDNLQPELSPTNLVVEYTAHAQAKLHVGGHTIPIADLPEPGTQVGRADTVAAAVNPSYHRVQIRVVEKGQTVPVPVKFHAHGEAGEYLAPVDRHRIPNHAWFEDYSTDFVHMPARGSTGPNGLPLGPHYCTYIPGETSIDVPLGRLFVEVSKGYEIKPIRRVFEISSLTEAITIELERVLPWRSRGWVSADTHVHFLSPTTALIEGSAEGVNVVNLLASQWGELMTNVGDFDGKSTWGSKEAGGDGEYLVRVGTENRQHVLGHISLLGYAGSIIAPMTTGGPDESTIGDPIEVLMTEWARQCKAQNGVVVIPHFPNPRLENAAVIVDGSADAIEMTSWGNLYGGISPYSLSDWYRFLNCGYPVAAVGGTDKMSASTAVGTARTYAQIPDGTGFTFDAWRDAVRAKRTFVTYGPMLELFVDGVPMGGTLELSKSGGTVDVTWEVASVTVPVSSVELMVNGEVAATHRVAEWDAESGKTRSIAGSFSVKIDRSSWLALLVRGHYPENPEVIAAHSSAVMVKVAGSEFYAERDALSILDQIEGSLAYIDTVGTRAETERYKQMRLVLESVHRRLHNRMHQLGHYHEHTAGEDHAEHH